MTTSARLAVVGTAVVALVLAHGTALATAQSKDQQKCITKLNKDGVKVAAAQGKANAKCVLFAGKGKLDKLGASNARDCLSADAKGKVQKKAGKTVADHDAFCTEDVPDFGLPTGTVGAGSGTAAAVNDAATGQELALVGDIFGPNLDGVVIDCDDDKAGCKCQAKVAKDLEKIAITKLKEFIKCKKFALKAGKEPFTSGAAAAADLEECVDDVGTIGSIADDQKSKIAKKLTKLKDDIANHCDTADVTTPEPFPGSCAGLTGDTLGDCIDQRVECRVCLMINAMDGLDVGCDQFDDSTVNDSCPPPAAIQQETVDIASGAEPDETPGSPGVVVTNPDLITQFGGSSFDLNMARYTRYHWKGSPAPNAILVLVPGFEGGAGTFKILAENLLARSRAHHGQILEVWAYDRRTNQLEDDEGLEIAESLRDPMVGLDWLFGAELGLTLHPALPGRRAVFHDSSADIPFLANWTSLVFSRDIDAVVAAAHTAVGNGNVFLGGHSAGTGFTARYAGTDFDLSGLGPAEPGYEKLRGLVLLEGGGSSIPGNPPSTDTLDRIEAKFDGGLFGAVRDQAPRCVDGTTACTIAAENADCAAFANTKCTEPTLAYAVMFGLLNPHILAAVEPAAIQGINDPDGGQIILQEDQGAPGNNAVAVVPELATLGLLPDSTAQGGIGTFVDDDGFIAGFASFVATSVGAPGSEVGGLLTWQDINEGPPPPSVLPNNGPVPTTLGAGRWGQEKEVTDFDRFLTTFYAGGTNFTDWYFPSGGLSMTSVAGKCDTTTTFTCVVGDVGTACTSNGNCSQSLGLDSTALSVDRGRRDIENLTQSANIDIPVIGFGGTNGMVTVPGALVAFAQSIGTCSAPSCDGSTARVVDASNPNEAFPTLGDVAGGFEAYMSEGFAHVDVLTAEDGPDNNVLGPLADFLARNSQ